MAKIPINSYQGSSAYIATIPIEDGNILYNSTTKEILVDENGTRIRYGGAIVVDTALSTTSTNPVQNKVITTNINTINANLSNITSDVSDLQTGLQSAEDSITNAFEVSAPIEKSPSTHNYAVGDYLIWNEALRIVTSPISTGQALTNSNTRLTNTGKELSQINSELTDTKSNLSSNYMKYKYVTKTVTIPQNTEIIIDLSGDLPTSITRFEILSARLGGYVLPYIEHNGATHANITLESQSAKTIRIYSSTTAWTNYELGLVIGYF